MMAQDDATRLLGAFRRQHMAPRGVVLPFLMTAQDDTTSLLGTLARRVVLIPLTMAQNGTARLLGTLARRVVFIPLMMAQDGTTRLLGTLARRVVFILLMMVQDDTTRLGTFRKIPSHINIKSSLPAAKIYPRQPLTTSTPHPMAPRSQHMAPRRAVLFSLILPTGILTLAPRGRSRVVLSSLVVAAEAQNDACYR